MIRVEEVWCSGSIVMQAFFERDAWITDSLVEREEMLPFCTSRSIRLDCVVAEPEANWQLSPTGPPQQS